MCSPFANTLEYCVNFFSVSPSKYIKTFFIEGLCCHVASCAIPHVTIGNPKNSCLISTVDKTHYGPITAPFSVQILKCLLQFFRYAVGFLVTNLFYCFAAANYNTQGTFRRIFFFCSDLLTCLRSVLHNTHKNRKWLKQPRSYLY